MDVSFFNKMGIARWRTARICVFLPPVMVVPPKAEGGAAQVLLGLNFQPREKAPYSDPNCLNKSRTEPNIPVFLLVKREH